MKKYALMVIRLLFAALLIFEFLNWIGGFAILASNSLGWD